ncbi:MAG: BMP family ABC transporter substrate-binding protein, partial [Chloroflexi bacterium]|nr:BMP family ABC transporter substrate-binding protein [Chloroflexota bacterium]
MVCRLLVLLWLSVGLILVGCASPPLSSPTISTSSSETLSPPLGPLRVAFLYFGKAADSNWTLAHEQGRLALLALPGVEADTRQDVPAGADALLVLRELATSDYDVIISTSLAFQDATWKAAEEFPQVRFLQCDGSQTSANLSTYFGWIEEPLYLAGMVAAGTSRSGKLGFVAAFPISEVIRNINAFTLGA